MKVVLAPRFTRALEKTESSIVVKNPLIKVLNNDIVWRLRSLFYGVIPPTYRR